MNDKTCASIPVRSPSGLRRTAAAALAKSDYIEARLDFMEPQDVPAALEELRPHLGKTVCTLRPKPQGGAFSGTEEERRSILKLIAEYNPYLLDVEYDALKKSRELARYMSRSGARVLVSWHDFEKTPGATALLSKMAAMSKYSRHLKLVGTARNAGDAARMLELYPRRGKNSLVSFAMGDAGRISRILCLYLGSPYTYASLGTPVAPGQFSVGEVKRLVGIGRKAGRA